MTNIPDAYKAFGQAFAGLTYSRQFPTWGEYCSESPAGQRAVIARWWQIAMNPWCEKFGKRGIEALRLWKRAKSERGENVNFSVQERPTDLSEYLEEAGADMDEAREKGWNL